MPLSRGEEPECGRYRRLCSPERFYRHKHDEQIVSDLVIMAFALRPTSAFLSNDGSNALSSATVRAQLVFFKPIKVS